jgi:hypothetical protein
VHLLVVRLQGIVELAAELLKLLGVVFIFLAPKPTGARVGVLVEGGNKKKKEMGKMRVCRV